MRISVANAANDLLERARHGDGAARAALVDRHYAAIYSLACKLTGRPEMARDVAQETFARAFAHLDKHDFEHSFNSWLFKIATNHVRDLHRGAGRREPPDVEPSAEGAEAILEKREDLERVRRALGALEPETRAAMILHLQESLPIREIAFVMDLTENAVRMKIYRGLQRVRAFVQEGP